MYRLMKLGVVAMLIVGVMAFGLMGGLTHEGEAQTFMVRAGGNGPGNIEVLAFGPSELQVHSGDTVMWHLEGFHDIHVGDQPAEFVIAPMVDGQPLPQVNPAMAFPTIENGGSYTGGEVFSGIPQGVDATATFSLVINAEPGRYMYFCDIHPGMVGVIEVVADDVEIPTPAEAELRGEQELGDTYNMAAAAMMTMGGDAPMAAVDGVYNVTLGSENTGRATVNLVTPFAATIHVGESVTWTNPAGSVDPHFVNSLPFTAEGVQDIVPMEQEGGPPLLLAGPGFLGTTPDGSTVSLGNTFDSPFIAPGQSYTLTFDEPGVYAYGCHIHPGMMGVVIVEPAV